MTIQEKVLEAENARLYEKVGFYYYFLTCLFLFVVAYCQFFSSYIITLIFIFVFNNDFKLCIL